MMPIEDHGLEVEFDEFSSRLDRRIHEFTEHGQFSVIAKKSGHDASTTAVLFERFFELLRDLDAETVKYIAQDHWRAGEIGELAPTGEQTSRPQIMSAPNRSSSCRPGSGQS